MELLPLTHSIDVCVCVISTLHIDTAIQPESYDDEFDAEDNGKSYEKDHDEHDDLASPPGSLTSGWRARGMREARRKAAFSCRPELDPGIMAEPLSLLQIISLCFCTVRELEYLTNMH